MVAHQDEAVAGLLEQHHAYYSRFHEKVLLFRKLKELVITVKSKIYDPQRKEPKIISPEEMTELQYRLDAALDELQQELHAINSLLNEEKNIERDEFSYTSKILSFIENELQNKAEIQLSRHGPKYLTLLQEIQHFLTESKQNVYGLLHLLSAQLDLLHDLESGRQEIHQEFMLLPQSDKALFRKLTVTFRILELEILRFGKYCDEEASIIQASNVVLRPFFSDYSTLRTLGLVYSEPRLSRHTVGLITAPFSATTRGVKGIGLIHDNGHVEIRFVKGKRERHAEVVQALFEGLAGMRLADDIAVKAYLHSLPMGKMTKIAGYEIQLNYDSQEQIQLINIDYSSTILEVQVERQALHEKMLRISRTDFERLNYALLFSIDRELLNNEVFRMNVTRKGHKITVTDTRIHPLLGS